MRSLWSLIKDIIAYCFYALLVIGYTFIVLHYAHYSWDYWVTLLFAKHPSTWVQAWGMSVLLLFFYVLFFYWHLAWWAFEKPWFGRGENRSAIQAFLKENEEIIYELTIVYNYILRFHFGGIKTRFARLLLYLGGLRAYRRYRKILVSASSKEHAVETFFDSKYAKKIQRGKNPILVKLALFEPFQARCNALLLFWGRLLYGMFWILVALGIAFLVFCAK
jgi:hypothetical protein